MPPRPISSRNSYPGGLAGVTSADAHCWATLELSIVRSSGMVIFLTVQLPKRTAATDECPSQASIPPAARLGSLAWPLQGTRCLEKPSCRPGQVQYLIMASMAWAGGSSQGNGIAAKAAAILLRH